MWLYEILRRHRSTIDASRNAGNRQNHMIRSAALLRWRFMLYSFARSEDSTGREDGDLRRVFAKSLRPERIRQRRMRPRPRLSMSRKSATEATASEPAKAHPAKGSSARSSEVAAAGELVPAVRRTPEPRGSPARMTAWHSLLTSSCPPAAFARLDPLAQTLRFPSPPRDPCRSRCSSIPGRRQ